MTKFLEQLPAEFQGVILMSLGIGVIVFIVLVGFYSFFRSGILKLPATVKLNTNGLSKKIQDCSTTITEQTAHVDKKLYRMEKDISSIRTSFKDDVDKTNARIDKNRDQISSDIRSVHKKIENLDYVHAGQCAVCHEGNQKAVDSISKSLDDFKVEMRQDIQALTSTMKSLHGVT